MECERQRAGQVLEVDFLGDMCSCLASATLVTPFCQEHKNPNPTSVPATASIPRTLKKEKGNLRQ